MVFAYMKLLAVVIALSIVVAHNNPLVNVLEIAADPIFDRATRIMPADATTDVPAQAQLAEVDKHSYIAELEEIAKTDRKMKEVNELMRKILEQFDLRFAANGFLDVGENDGHNAEDL